MCAVKFSINAGSNTQQLLFLLLLFFALQCQGLLNRLINLVPQFQIHWVIKEMNSCK